MGAFDDLIPEGQSSENAFEDLIPPAKKKSPLLGGMGAVASGSNRMMLAGLPGLPVDTALNVWDLAKAGAGTLYGKATGNAPPEFLDPTNRAEFPMSSSWIERQIAKVPGGEAVIASDAAQYPKLHAAGQAIGGTIGS